ncbi:hypothetical protein CAPTEDRAFT_193098 [Capitella teleta]|uniref:Uncharacterized protein n=1 Tax=Capitella teleta TaxID=283909 RepID=R7UBL6_CAPTE|nr:hypothetical protein CAPTEDRAFT_193098 [Capitella teleta]|eukprot:ELU00662.1 hypothetical protein CAPTEDRAFT_193098 [Capitella teleta]
MELVNSTLKLDPPLDITEVDRIHRVGKPASATNQRNKPRAILVKLATYRSRKRIMDLRPQTKTLPDVFLNEDLTKKREDLLYKAHVLRRAGKIQGAWSADGNILIHDLQGKIHKDYELVTANRPERIGGGVAIYVHRSIDFNQRKDLGFFVEGKIEGLFIEMKVNRKSLIVGKIYRFPKVGVSQSIESYSEILRSISATGKDSIIGTDHMTSWLLIPFLIHTPLPTYIYVLIFTND